MCCVRAVPVLALIHLSVLELVSGRMHAQGAPADESKAMPNHQSTTHVSKNAITVTSSGVVLQEPESVVRRVAAGSNRDVPVQAFDAQGFRNVRRVSGSLQPQRKTNEHAGFKANHAVRVQHKSLVHPILTDRLTSVRTHDSASGPNYEAMAKNLWHLVLASIVLICVAACVLYFRFRYSRFLHGSRDTMAAGTAPTAWTGRQTLLSPTRSGRSSLGEQGHDPQNDAKFYVRQSQVEKQEEKKEQPTTVQELELILRADPRLNLDQWGKNAAKSLQELLQETMQGACELHWSRDARNGEFYLVRTVCILTVVIRATTSKGVRSLKKSAPGGVARDLAKKFKKTDDPNEVAEKIVRDELNLDAAWQKAHMIKEGATTRYVQKDADVKRFPGLGMRYANVEMKMHVANPTHEACVAIGLPDGDNFSIMDDTNSSRTNKERCFVWAVPDIVEKDEDPYSGKLAKEVMGVMSSTFSLSPRPDDFSV